MKRLFFLLFCLYGVLYSNAQNTVFRHPKHEVRAVWLTTIGGLDWPHSYSQSTLSARKQQQELCSILDKLQRGGINQVFVQTRIRATTIYPSALEPWDGCLSGIPGKSPGYDALAFATDECHKRGMEIHAWVVAVPVGKWNGYGCRRLRTRRPELLKKIGDEGFMNPEQPQTAAYIADICEEIVRNYDIDGIHLDYIRYPETWKIKVSGNEGRRNITRIVQAVSSRIKPIKPYAKLSCSPIGKFDDLPRYRSYGWNAYTRVCQDAQGWLRDGIMDELLPMMYFRGEQFFPFAIDWSECSYGRIVAPGLGIYFMSPNEKNWPLEVITREMEVLRNYGLGHAYFRSKFFTDNVKGIYTFAKDRFCTTPALVPPMTWAQATPPAMPQQTSADAKTLCWKRLPDTYYNIYASRNYPVDVDDARNLVMARTQKDRIETTKGSGELYFAVTAMNRYGLESEPLQQAAPPSVTRPTAMKLMQCDGKLVRIPAADRNSDADMLVVEDLKGRRIATMPYRGTTADVSRIDNGIYQLRTLNRRGISHRLGFFLIKRL